MMYEFALREWGVSHVTINNEWTDEEFQTLITRSIETRQREIDASKRAREEAEKKRSGKKMTLAEFAAQKHGAATGDIVLGRVGPASEPYPAPIIGMKNGD